nr:Phage minor tail protein L [uncultured Mediterranean phage uvMED]BAR23126.1 Phage minor tail protein L [uncultured Mediterranean phage uvMED]BAR23271.1 Phage minor tail protein L [uncultured Mediterranean phage uvMED]
MSYSYYNTDGTKSVHAWKANTFYAVGDVVRASPEERHTLAFKCIVAGTSGSNEPAFPRQITSTIVDNASSSLEWEAFEPLAGQLQALAPTAVIDLFEIKLTSEVNDVDDTLRYHAGKNGLIADIIFDSKTYPAAPVEVDGFEFTAKGTLPRPTLRVANANGAISSLLALYNPLKARVRRIRTFAKFLDAENFNQVLSSQTEGDDAVTTEGGDSLIYQTFNDTADPDAKMVETWYIDRVSSENLQFVEFELTARLDLTNLQLPRRTVTEFCQWEYRKRECPYRGDKCFTIDDEPITGGTLQERKDADACGKRVSSCQLRFPNQTLPFGGFPGARLQA